MKLIDSTIVSTETKFDKIYYQILKESPKLGFEINPNRYKQIIDYIENGFINDSHIDFHNFGKSTLAIRYAEYCYELFLVDSLEQKNLKMENFHFYSFVKQFPLKIYNNCYKISISIKLSNNIQKVASSCYMLFLHLNPKFILLSDNHQSDSGYTVWLEMITNKELCEYFDFNIYNYEEESFYSLKDKSIQDIWGYSKQNENISISMSKKGLF